MKHQNTSQTLDFPILYQWYICENGLILDFENVLETTAFVTCQTGGFGVLY